MTANLRQAAGSLLVVGLGGAELTGLERAWLKLVRPAGIILFRRNIADARQTRALLAEATDLCAPQLSAAWTWKAARSIGCATRSRLCPPRRPWRGRPQQPAKTR